MSNTERCPFCGRKKGMINKLIKTIKEKMLGSYNPTDKEIIRWLHKAQQSHREDGEFAKLLWPGLKEIYNEKFKLKYNLSDRLSMEGYEK